eukprot:scaffold160259_cov30-Tisochrysis_lutea.AAC.2
MAITSPLAASTATLRLVPSRPRSGSGGACKYRKRPASRCPGADEVSRRHKSSPPSLESSTMITSKRSAG